MSDTEVDRMAVIRRDLTEDEWKQIESQRAAQSIVGGDRFPRYDMVSLAREVKSLDQQLRGAVDTLRHVLESAEHPSLTVRSTEYIAHAVRTYLATVDGGQ